MVRMRHENGQAATALFAVLATTRILGLPISADFDQHLHETSKK
jgi:hypothetical protein